MMLAFKSKVPHMPFSVSDLQTGPATRPKRIYEKDSLISLLIRVGALRLSKNPAPSECLASADLM